MILDCSAVVAVVQEELGHEELEQKMREADSLAIGAPTLVDSGQSHWEAAADVFMRFGKGRHPAALNYGDCMTYATARIARRPLLFIGDDFARTDVETA